MKDFVKGELQLDDIIELVRERREKFDETEKYEKFAVKALYIKSKNMLNAMEFREAKRYLEVEAKPILYRLIKKYSVKKED